MLKWTARHLMQLSADLADGAGVKWRWARMLPCPFARWPRPTTPAYCPRGFVLPVFEGSFAFVDTRINLA